MPPLLIEQGEVQLGVDGPIVKIDAGKVEIKSADGAEYVTLKANFESATPAGIPTQSVLRLERHATTPAGIQNYDIWMDTNGYLLLRLNGNDFPFLTGDPI